MLQHADSSDIMKKVIMTMPDSSCKLTLYPRFGDEQITQCRMPT